MKQLIRILLLSILITIVGLGTALTLKAAIGVGAWDALAQSVSTVSGIKVGTMGIILNCLCIFGQWIILRKKFKLEYLLQLPVSIFLGTIINFFYYNVLGHITIDSYVLNLLLLVVAYVIVASSIGSIMALGIFTFALEGFCLVLADKANWKFTLVRQLADVISIILSIVLTFQFSLSFTVREGTIIGMLIFAPLMGFFIKKTYPILRRLGI